MGHIFSIKVLLKLACPAYRVAPQQVVFLILSVTCPKPRNKSTNSPRDCLPSTRRSQLLRRDSKDWWRKPLKSRLIWRRNRSSIITLCDNFKDTVHVVFFPEHHKSSWHLGRSTGWWVLAMASSDGVALPGDGQRESETTSWHVPPLRGPR